MRDERVFFWTAKVLPQVERSQKIPLITHVVSSGASLYLAGAEADQTAAVYRLRLTEGRWRVEGKWCLLAPNSGVKAKTPRLADLCVNDADTVLAAVCVDGWLYVERAQDIGGKRLRAHRAHDQLRAVALDPNYDTSLPRSSLRVVVGGDQGELALYGESWLGLSQTAVLYRSREAITNIAWHAHFISWATLSGTVRVYDSDRHAGVCSVEPPASLGQRTLPPRARLQRTRLFWTSGRQLCISWWYRGANEDLEHDAQEQDPEACVAIRVLSFNENPPEEATNAILVQTQWSCCRSLFQNGFQLRLVAPCSENSADLLFVSSRMRARPAEDSDSGMPSDAEALERLDEDANFAAGTLELCMQLYAYQQIESEEKKEGSGFVLANEQLVAFEWPPAATSAAAPVQLPRSRLLSAWSRKACALFMLYAEAAVSTEATEAPWLPVIVQVRPCNIVEQVRWLHAQHADASAVLALARLAVQTDAQALSAEELASLADAFLEAHWEHCSAAGTPTAEHDEIAARIPEALEWWNAPTWLWEKWIRRLLAVGRGALLVSVIPTQSPVLERQVYDIIFHQLIDKPEPGMLYAAQNWPLEIFSVDELIEALERRLQQVRTAPDASSRRAMLIMTESLSALYTRSGRTEKTLFLILEQDGTAVFSYIRKHRLFAAARQCLGALFALDAAEAARTLAMASPLELSIDDVLGALEPADSLNAMLYLEEVFRQAPDLLHVPEHHERLLELLVKHAPERILALLQSEDCFCRPQVARSILARAETPDRQFLRERALLHALQGDLLEALKILLEGEMEGDALELARQQASDAAPWGFLAAHMRDPQRLLLVRECALSRSQVLMTIGERRLAGEAIKLETPVIREAYYHLEEQRQCSHEVSELLKQRIHKLEQAYASALFDDLVLPPTVATDLKGHLSVSERNVVELS